MRKLLIYGLMLMLCMSLASALTCTYSTNPSYTPLNWIEWNCITGNNTYCYTYAYFGDDLIQANPIPTLNEDQDAVFDGFDCDGVCTVLFSPKDLRTDLNVTFGVVCEGETVEVVVTPELQSSWGSESVMDRSIWLRNNAAYVAMGIFLLVGVLGALSIMWKIVKP